MCVIIAKKAGVEPLNEDYFNNAWDKNPDGGGIVWKEKGKRVMVQKGFMKKEDMLEVLKKVNTKDTSFIAHFRIKSVGDVKPENCHPFVMKNVTFAHNGTLSITPIEGKTDSETFGLAILHNHTMKWIKDNQLLLEMALGTSKFAIMDNITGEIFVLNPELGKEKDDAWFSNESAFTPKATYNYASSTHASRWTGMYDDDDYLPLSATSKTAYMPTRTLGTKNFKESDAWYYYDDARGAWIDKQLKTPKRPYQLGQSPVLVGKNGLWMIDKSIKPGDDLEKKIYSKKSCPEYSYLFSAQAELNRLLSAYKQSSFNTWDERNEFEEEIHALNIVLNGCRRLVVNGKALSLDNLVDYIYTPIVDGRSNANVANNFIQTLSYYIEECQETLAVKNKLNHREIDQVRRCVANA